MASTLYLITYPLLNDYLSMNSTNMLLADDDLDDYNFFTEALESVFPNSKVQRAKNGLECLTALKRNEKPQIIFLALNIPIKSGLECLDIIKKTDELCDVPVIIYSKSHYIKNIDDAYKLGAYSYIIKPGVADNLVETLIAISKD